MQLVLWLLAIHGVAGSLCHGAFRSLEHCLGHDYERLRTECGSAYAGLKACLQREWRHTDATEQFSRPDKGFNRLKQCRHGLMLYNPLDWYIGRSLEVYGEWGEKKVQLWEHLVQPGQVALEIGAHVGTLTLPLSRLVGSGRVIAFEPFYPSFAALAANTALNSLDNVELRQAVVADRAGKVFMDRGSLAFKQQDFFNYGSIDFQGLDILPADAERQVAWDEYPVVTLDGLSMSQVDFIKIDAEGLELAVLRGARRLLRKSRPLLFVEYRSPKQKDPRLLHFLRKAGYECVLLRLPVFNERNFRNHPEDLWGSLVSFDLLCRNTRRDTEGKVASLFTSAVETDVKGLRTTPTDPLDILERARPSAGSGKGQPKLQRPRGGASASRPLGAQSEQDKPAPMAEEMSQELSAEEHVPQVRAAKQDLPDSHLRQVKFVEPTLDEL